MITKEKLDKQFLYAANRYEATGKSVWDKIAVLIVKVTPILVDEQGKFIKFRIWHIGRMLKLVTIIVEFINGIHDR